MTGKEKKRKGEIALARGGSPTAGTQDGNIGGRRTSRWKLVQGQEKDVPCGGREIEGRMAPGFHGKTAVCDAKPLKGQGGGPFLTRRQLYKQRLCRTHLPLNEMDNSLLYFRYFSHQRKFQIFKFSRLAQVARGLPTIDPNPRDSLGLRYCPSPRDTGPGRCLELPSSLSPLPSLTVSPRNGLPSACPVLPGCPRECV